jgi:hypothetical protein
MNVASGSGRDGSGSAAVALLALSLLVFGCASPDIPRKHSDFAVGMSRSAVLSRFGPPDRHQTLVKTSGAVWGPIEDFWPEIPLGARVEIWSYRSKAEVEGGSPDAIDGSTELYFIGDSELVDGIGFAVEGAIYEATP